ncbi:MAG: heme NO-binding domain-containing protein [Candidatus Omnitrophica bacterium]|nr:heme NO-binding domain-containing protein [Candidatus Omnitrophota bacterium]
MKGVIVICLHELVKDKFGQDKWELTLQKSGIDPNKAFTAGQDVDDAIIFKVLGTLCEVLNITLQQAFDAFGDYWVNVFAPKVYKAYYQGVKNSRDFLLKMDKIHETTTCRIEGACPPRFGYDWKNDKTLIMNYSSQRKLIDLLVSLIKGVGTYFKEDIKVRKVNETQVEVIFP